MKRILVRSGKNPFDVTTTEETLQRNVIGNNVGNLVFATAAHKLLTTPDTEVVSNRNVVDPARAEAINEEYDAFVIPLANAFRPSFERHLNTLTDLITRLTIPVTVLGVGAQSDLEYDLECLAPLNASVRRFVSAVLDRSPSIGVRGEFSAGYLESLGFRDVEVIGCPSMFMFGADLKVTKRTTRLDADSRIGMYLTKGVDRLDELVANHDRYRQLRYIPQDIKDLELLYWGDGSIGAGRTATFPADRSHPMLTDGRIDYYLDPWTWMTGLADRDFTFGTRIHGNIVALLAGTPGFVVAHDSRTLELSRYFEIPYRKVTDPGGLDAAELYEAADYTAVMAGHNARFERMTGFLRTHDLDNCFAHPQTVSEFDTRLRATAYPGPETVWRGDDDGRLHHRIGQLREQQTRTADRINGLVRRVRELEKLPQRVERLETELAATREQLAQVRKYVAGQEARLSARLRRRLARRFRPGRTGR